MMIIGDVLEKVIQTVFDNGLSWLKEENEFRKFKNEIKNWCNDYITRNETTIVASSAFIEYIKHYNLIGKIINFVRCPAEQLEELFIQECYDRTVEILKEENALTQEDHRCIKEFICGILQQTKLFYENKVSTDNTANLYYDKQELAEIRAANKNIHENMERLTPKKPILVKKEYPYPQNTIERKFVRYKDIQEGLYFSLRSESMLEVCLKEKHVVLLGEAGCGKSVALDQLASMASNSYFTLLYNLNNYTGETIDQIIDKIYNDIDKTKVFLIFDGYDEIEEVNRNGFARKLAGFVSINSDTVVLVSSRNNFYKFADDEGRGGLFDSFKEYGIAPITQTDMNHYVENNGINSSDFFGEVEKKELRNIVSTPFYLRELVKIYQHNYELPSKADIMEEIICNRFDKDSRKYSRTEDLEDYEVEIFSCLKKLAFALQCLNSVKISNDDYQMLFSNTEQRKLIKYSGIFSKDSNKKWGFEHNNFREFLTAKYINQLGFEAIQQLIFTPQGKVIDSWTNVLSFLVLIREKNDLLQFLMENDPEMIVKFERGRIDEDSRTNIVINILSVFAEKSMWISHGFNSAEHIARFGQSAKFCDFLLDQIAHPINFRAQNNALTVLSEFTDLYGMEEIIQNTLFNCLKAEEVRYYEKHKVLNAIASLGLQSAEITSYVIDTFRHDMNPDYRLGVLQYLNQSELYEEYIDFFTEEYKIAERDFDESLSIRNEVMNVFAKVKQCNALCRVIVSLAKQRRHFSIDEKMYDFVISNAVESFNNRNSKVFDTIVDNLLECEIYNHNFFIKCLVFFEKTNTRISAFMKIVEMDCEVNKYTTISALKLLGDEKCYNFLISAFHKESDKYKSIVTTLTLQFDETSSLYACYKDALCQSGIPLPKRKPLYDYQKAKQCGKQYFFECLLDKEKYCALVEKMVTSIGNPRITFSELEKVSYHPVNYDDMSNYSEEYALLELYYSLIGLYNDDKVVLDTIIGIPDWKQYIISESFYLLKSDDKIEINEEAKTLFFEYCNSLLSVIDFQSEIHEDEDLSITYTYRLAYFIFFSMYFNFQYPQEIYKKMLLVPNFLFNEKPNNYEKFPSYVVSNLTDCELKKQIKHDLVHEKMCSHVVDTHIQFCKDNKLNWGVSAAERICLEKSSASWLKHKCIEYLEQIKGCDYIYNKFLDIDDEELIECIKNVTLKYKDIRLKKRLEEINKTSSDKYVHLTALIFLNSKYGLQQYYDISKSTMKSTSITDKTIADPIIDAISSVNDIDLLNELDNLRELIFTPGFEDKGLFNLQNALFKAYENLAKFDYSVVKGRLEAGLKKDSILDSEKSFCNTLIHDIEQTHNQNYYVIWTVKKIKEFWDEHIEE